jgi:hypothetical protein
MNEVEFDSEVDPTIIARGCPGYVPGNQLICDVSNAMPLNYQHVRSRSE